MASAAVKWRVGFSVRGLSAKRARAEIERVRASCGGRLTPEDVVEAARARSSPLHAAFCWDDTEAARLYRLVQARNVIGAIVVVHRDEGPVREYVRLPKVREYAPTVEAMKDPKHAEGILDRALAELDGMLVRYRSYRALAGLLDDVRLVVTKHRRRAKRPAD